MEGWEPAEVITYEYEDDRVVRAVIVREPEWTADERAYLLASRAIELEPKNSLGIPLVDAMNPDNQFKWIPPTEPSMDWSLNKQGNAIDAYYKKYPDVSRNGHMWRPPTLKD